MSLFWGGDDAACLQKDKNNERSQIFDRMLIISASGCECECTCAVASVHSPGVVRGNMMAIWKRQ